MENLTNKETYLELIQKTIAPNASHSELSTFLYLGKEYNLDPLKKEIYFIKYGGKASILISRDGYLKIANENPQFNGLESEAVYVGDKVTKRKDGSLLIEYGEAHMIFDKSKLIGAFCNVFRKDRDQAVSVFVNIKEYYKKSNIWDQYTSTMIIKVAESSALKKAFSINVPDPESVEFE